MLPSGDYHSTLLYPYSVYGNTVCSVSLLFANLRADINKLLYYFLCSLFVMVLIIKMVLVSSHKNKLHLL